MREGESERGEKNKVNRMSVHVLVQLKPSITVNICETPFCQFTAAGNGSVSVHITRIFIAITITCNALSPYCIDYPHSHHLS